MKLNLQPALKRLIVIFLLSSFAAAVLPGNVIAKPGAKTWLPGLADTGATTKVVKVPVKKAVPATVNCKVSEIVGFSVDSITAVAHTKNKNAGGEARLSQNNKIEITITNPRDFLLSRPADNTPLILYVDGFPLKGMSTEFFSGISRQYLNDTTKCWPNTIVIPFVFTRDTSNEEAWISMFKLTRWNKNKIAVKMSMGWAGMFPLNVSATANPAVKNEVTVVFYDRKVFWIFSVIYALFLAAFGYFCYTSGLIRDPDNVNNGPGPYSLSQTQLAFWTVIVIGGFCYLWLLTGQADSINTSILLLLGISGGTTGTATFIDYYKKTAILKANAAQNPTVTTTSVVAPAVVPNAIKQHRNFLNDILSDGVNMSVQRTQTALWNLVLGLYFLWFVVTNKSMPEFNNTLLVLAGVSSALYVASKPMENPQTKPTPTTP